MKRRLLRRLRAFSGASLDRKLLSIEAAFFLVRARLLTLLPARIYTRALGAPGSATPPEPTPAQIARAAEIGHVVAISARAVPFRAKCLQQVIAVRSMLRRRSLPGTAHLGLSRDASPDDSETREAHAWVACGTVVINGDHGLDRYVSLERYT